MGYHLVLTMLARTRCTKGKVVFLQVQQFISQPCLHLQKRSSAQQQILRLIVNQKLSGYCLYELRRSVELYFSG